MIWDGSSKALQSKLGACDESVHDYVNPHYLPSISSDFFWYQLALFVQSTVRWYSTGATLAPTQATPSEIYLYILAEWGQRN